MDATVLRLAEAAAKFFDTFQKPHADAIRSLIAEVKRKEELPPVIALPLTPPPPAPDAVSDVELRPARRRPEMSFPEASPPASNAEEWRALPSSPTIEVSSWGNVRKRTGDTIVAVPFCALHTGYNYCAVPKFKAERVHILVARLFVPGYAPGLQVHHRDSDKRNNHWTNLEWMTPSQNQVLCHLRGRVRRVLPTEDIVKMRALREAGSSVKELCEMFGLESGHVSKILTGKRRKAA